MEFSSVKLLKTTNLTPLKFKISPWLVRGGFFFFTPCSSRNTVLFLLALGRRQRVVAELICRDALRWQIADKQLTNSWTQCHRYRGHLHSTLPDYLMLCGDLLALHGMTTMLHPSLSLSHKGAIYGGRCCCLLVRLCHHYDVTDKITRRGVG